MQQNHNILNLEKSCIIYIRVWSWDCTNEHKVQ